MVCSRCREELPESEFAWKNKKTGRRQSYCRPCSKQYHAEHYRANKQTYLDNVQSRKVQIREVIASLKEAAPCSDCGMYYPACVMDYDHLGDKEFNVSHAVAWGLSIDRIMTEIAKCDLVCSNCHRIRTHT